MSVGRCRGVWVGIAGCEWVWVVCGVGGGVGGGVGECRQV